MRFNLIKRLSSLANYTAFILFVLHSQHAVGQQATIPCGLNYKTYETIPARSLPAIDAALFNKPRHQVSGKIISETVGYNFKTHFDPDSDGSWKTISPGVDSWFLKLRSNDAFGLALVFSGVELMPGETLYIYNQNSVRGPYTNLNIPRSKVLPLDFLMGEEIMIEYDVPARRIHGTFTIETVSHAYRNIFSHTIQNSKGGMAARTSDNCYLCIEDDAISKERRAVVKLVVQYDSTA